MSSSKFTIALLSFIIGFLIFAAPSSAAAAFPPTCRQSLPLIGCLDSTQTKCSTSDLCCNPVTDCPKEGEVYGYCHTTTPRCDGTLTCVLNTCQDIPIIAPPTAFPGCWVGADGVPSKTACSLSGNIFFCNKPPPGGPLGSYLACCSTASGCNNYGGFTCTPHGQTCAPNSADPQSTCCSGNSCSPLISGGNVCVSPGENGGPCRSSPSPCDPSLACDIPSQTCLTAAIANTTNPVNKDILGTCPQDADSTSISTALGCLTFSTKEPNKIIQDILSWATGISATIAFIMIIIAAFQITTAAGDPKRVKAGQELLTSAVAGFVLIALSVVILNFLGVHVLGLQNFGFQK